MGQACFRCWRCDNQPGLRAATKQAGPILAESGGESSSPAENRGGAGGAEGTAAPAGTLGLPLEDRAAGAGSGRQQEPLVCQARSPRVPQACWRLKGPPHLRTPPGTGRRCGESHGQRLGHRTPTRGQSAANSFWGRSGSAVARTPLLRQLFSGVATPA